MNSSTNRAKRKSLTILSAGFLLFCLSLSTAVEAKSYRSHLRKWSRHKELFSATTMKVAIICDATFFSNSFRKAHNKAHIKRKLLDGDDRERFLEKQAEQESKGHEFFVSMYTPREMKNFSLDEASFWKARLKTESGETLKPLSIEFVEVTPYTHVMFPYVTRWSYAYRVVFPREEMGKRFTLTLHSPVGHTDLNWN